MQSTSTLSKSSFGTSKDTGWCEGLNELLKIEVEFEVSFGSDDVVVKRAKFNGPNIKYSVANNLESMLDNLKIDFGLNTRSTSNSFANSTI